MIVVAETQHQIHTTGPIVVREITRFEIYFGEFPDKLIVLVLAFALDTRIASGCGQRIAVQLPAFRGNGRLLRTGSWSVSQSANFQPAAFSTIAISSSAKARAKGSFTENDSSSIFSTTAYAFSEDTVHSTLAST